MLHLLERQMTPSRSNPMGTLQVVPKTVVKMAHEESY